MNLFNRNKKADLPRRRLHIEDEKSSVDDNVFKRNRTITGTKSSKLDSVNTKSDQISSPRAHVHHLTIKRRKVFSILFSVLLICAMLWLFISNFTAEPVVSISDTSVSVQIDNKSYEKVISDYLGINPMSRFHFLMDKVNLSSYVSSKLPEVLSVEQGGMIGVGQTDFVLTMRKPVASWAISNKQYYVDSSGVAFEKNYFTTPSVKVIDNSGITVKSDTAVVSNRLLSFVGLVVSTAKSSGYTVTQAVLPINTTRELDISLKECGYYIKLSIDRPVGEQIEDMSRVIKFLASKGRAPGYVDVRVSGKAFYK